MPLLDDPLSWPRDLRRSGTEIVLASEYDALRARLAEAEELVGDMVGVLRGHRFCGDDFPSNGWSEVNAVLARYAKFTRRPVNGSAPQGDGNA